MIEYQQRYPEFPGHPWHELPDDEWQLIVLSDIKKYRFRFHDKLVESRRYLAAYMEKEIITARLFNRPLQPRILNGDWKQ